MLTQFPSKHSRPKPPRVRGIPLERRAMHCHRCGLLLAHAEHRPGSPCCLDCETGAPLCQMTQRLGVERFFQKVWTVNVFADVIAPEYERPDPDTGPPRRYPARRMPRKNKCLTCGGATTATYCKPCASRANGAHRKGVRKENL